MRYLTDYKRVAGHGSAHSGAHHHWQMQVSSVALAILIPIFIFMFGSTLGSDYETAIAYFSRPVPAVVAGLTFVVGLLHFKSGAQIMIEDYAQGMTRQALIMLVTGFSYVCIGLGLFALVKIAL
ncbi:succinate dehydrogenase, hydrophobic membrane anchor protein [Falsirhodobacter halotolerans]|uniref:succinate dehydrogenase, hydrophobic membrane anchor protein n=1 Tax=Falsirhodobacter halotolerans TaxID=1146892 RepID=UPI001FD00DA1|nr:succinate dehydrogenase, hydrophobic membrane anchor protein [Falsirhodobacter halotolerans]MCJ8140445.1 succinate dehydrogenase, hydrophobic membrane anchor protein [Falsirhodobacter halotolerans]